MSDLMGYLDQHRVQENAAVETFMTALAKQIEAIEKETLNRRSWAKPEGTGFLISLGKLGGTYRVHHKEGAKKFLSKIAADARDTPEFIALIEEAYGAPETKPKKSRRRGPALI